MGKLSLEELMEVEVTPVVTSVSRRSEKASQTPAAVFVISSEDIRRSGYTNLPDVLRLAPGLNVARIDGSKWAISARGTNSRFSGNLLVLIDGRSVYSPLYSGVYWDVQNMILEDIERIEVVRGPGGTTWGANAVNGVINIVTKSAHVTESGLLSIGCGTYDGSDIQYRYGSKLENNGSFRFYFKGFDRKPLRTPDLGKDVDDYGQGRFGFRFDWESTPNRKMTLDGTMYKGDSHEMLVQQDVHDPRARKANSSSTDVSGGDLRFQLTQTLRPGEEFRLQLYFDRTRRVDGVHGELLDTFDLDLQHQFSPWKRHELVWGLGYRLVKYSLQNGPNVTFNPNKGTTGVQSFFVQDQITLKPRHLFLTLGTKVYHHPYVGTEGQPSFRLLWTPREKHVLWTAYTEAHRIPSIAERSGSYVREFRKKEDDDPILVQNVENQSLKSEFMKAKEVGYRFLPNSRLSLDMTYFQQDYFSLARTVAKSDPGDPNKMQQVGSANSGSQRIHGLELSFQWKPKSTFRVVGGHTADWQTSSTDSGGPRDVPPRQWFLRTYWDISKEYEFDLSFQHNNAIDSTSTSSDMPRTDTMNARLGWRPNKYFDLSIGGQYLLKSWHKEFPAQSDYLPSDIPRNYYLKATWHF